MVMNRQLIPVLIMGLPLLAGACASLPVEGPSGRAVADHAQASGYALVDLTPMVSRTLKAVAPQGADSLIAAESALPIDRIGVGDTLAITVYEPSGALFGARSGGNQVQGASQGLPPAVVDASGQVQVPFAGAVRVQGLTAGEAAEAIRRALAGRVGHPQVTVSVSEAPSTGVVVMGEVRNPGRVGLAAGRDRLLDVIAAAGGPSRLPEEIVVEIHRNGVVFTAPYTAVTTDFAENVRLAPGDRVGLVHRPRRYSMMGALGAVAEAEMGPGRLSLAAALARAGGPSPDTADARSVLVFRFERPEAARALGLAQAATERGVPVVYRLDLSAPDGLFVASDFDLRPDDLVFVPRSGSTELRQFFELVQSVTRVVYDVSVTSALGRD